MLPPGFSCFVFVPEMVEPAASRARLIQNPAIEQGGEGQTGGKNRKLIRNLRGHSSQIWNEMNNERCKLQENDQGWLDDRR
jgi:hypothetical protein